MSDYRFPIEDEENTLIEEVSEMFVVARMESKQIPLISDEFAKLLFQMRFQDDTHSSRQNLGDYILECPKGLKTYHFPPFSRI